jgi:hypothetical protein
MSSHESALDDARIRWCVTLTDGSASYGPAQSDQMRRWLEEGRIPADAYVWREGWSHWRRADAVFPRLLASELQDQGRWISEVPPAAGDGSPHPGRRPIFAAQDCLKPPSPSLAPRHSEAGLDWVQMAAMAALGLAFAALAATAYLALRT